MYVSKLLEQPQILTIFTRAHLGPLSDRFALWELFQEIKTLFKQSVFKKMDVEVLISRVFLFPPFTLRGVVWVVCYSHTRRKSYFLTEISRKSLHSFAGIWNVSLCTVKLNKRLKEGECKDIDKCE